jgi:hypothetical protein
VSRNKRFYRHNEAKPDPLLHKEDEYHQCTLAAKYKIYSIDLYVCNTHASGIDKNQLIEI